MLSYRRRTSHEQVTEFIRSRYSCTAAAEDLQAKFMATELKSIRYGDINVNVCDVLPWQLRVVRTLLQSNNLLIPARFLQDSSK